MKKIDAHIHYYLEDSYFNRIAADAGHENTQEHLRKTFAELDIAHAIVMGNRSLSTDKHHYPDFLSYCIGLDHSVFDPTQLQTAVEQVAQHLSRPACVGIKIYAGYNPYYLTDDVYAPFIELAGEHGKPIAVHTGVTVSSSALLKYSHPMVLDEAAVRYPRVQFVMCHIGNPWVIDAAAVLEKNNNVVADLSGLLVGRIDIPNYLREQAGYVEYLKTWIAYVENYDKFLYGTDWPLVNMGDYAGIIERLIPERHLEKVFFDNAARVYGLKV